MGVVLGGLGLAALATAWWIRLPSLVAEGGGPVQPLGVSVGKEIPSRFGRWPSLSMPGLSPVRLFFRLPGLARSIRGSSSYDWREPDAPPSGCVAVRLVLPNGSTCPLDIQRDEDRLLVNLRGDVPPSLNRLAIEIFVPGRPTSRFGVVNAGVGTIVFDTHRRVAAQGGVSGEAWWQPQEKGSPAPALFSRLSVGGFRLRPGEIGEIHFRTEGPFAERGHESWIRMGSSSKLDAEQKGVAMWVGTPYAGYAKALHSIGTVRRYRFFDETIDLGTAPLHQRRQSFGSPNDAAPALSAPRTAATPGGLRVTIPTRSIDDNNGFAMGMTVSVPLDVDRASVVRGLPPDMARLARRSPVEISIKPVSRKEDWFTALDYDARLREPGTVSPRYVSFMSVAKRRLTDFPLRFRVRRQVLVEATPFDLTVPVVGPRHTVKYRRDSGENSEGVF